MAKSNDYSHFDLPSQIYMECLAMAKHALAKGKPVPAEPIKTIDAFTDYAVEENSPQHIPAIRRNLDISELVTAHNVLVQIIEPATPKTVLLLYMDQHSDTWFKFLGPVALVRQLTLAAAIALIVFIGMMVTPYISSSNLAADVLSAAGIDQLARLVFYISAAGLGATFAGLYTVKNYISKGTFDPCYQAAYWIRFLLGIIAGLLLAIIVSEHSLQSEGYLTKGIIRPLLAILGGFSADLLYTFLNRMVETFKSVFEGGIDSKVQTKTQEAKTKLAGEEMARRTALSQELMKLQQSLGQEPTPAQLKQQVDNLLHNLIQPK